MDRTNGTTNLVFKNFQDLAEFKEEINEAQGNNQPYVEFRGTQLSISNALTIEADARKQLELKQEVLERGDVPQETTENKREVLIIEENTDELGFTDGVEQLVQIQSLKLLPNEYLNANIQLKSHQEQGIAWLQHLLTHNTKGCLLADDMGLGKTLQLLYLIDWHSREHNKGNKPYLIVAPVSLLENWEQEYEKFFAEPRLNIIRVSGAPRTLDREFVKKMSKNQVILTSYEGLRSGQLSFGAIDFAIIVLDEAQKIKTPGTQVTNAAKALKGEFKVAMTGTPVENSFMDLWCITDFSIPGLLGNAKNFAKKYHHSLKREGADVVALGNEIRESIGDYILRRLKSDIADQLPEKLTKYSQVKMPKAQLDRYKIAINMGLDNDDDAPGVNMLTQIMSVRTIVDHPYLLDNNFDSCSEEEIINSSAKLLSTFEILDTIREKSEKVIIFTERRDMQRILQRTIYYRYGLSPSLINGDTATVAGKARLSRQQTIDYFWNYLSQMQTKLSNFFVNTKYIVPKFCYRLIA
ncbi:MAG: SNF2-related protein [Rikenellaceae bacterium]